MILAAPLAPDSLPAFPQPPAQHRVLPDSTPATDTGHFFLAPVVVKAARRAAARPSEAPRTWSTPSSLGLAGPLEALRNASGTAFSNDISGQFASCGMPTEGSLVSWEGAPLLWPWHFGGLFGALDDKAIGSVRWQSLPAGESPARGGGWLETRSRAWGDTDAVHGAVQLGFVAGGVSSWGRQGDWGWQVGVRRTWLGAALDLAHRNGWSDQEMDAGFTDGTAALTFRRGPWKALIGFFGSEDTLGLTLDTTTYEYAWSNLALPLRLGWEQGNWALEASGSWSRYRRNDADLFSQDTLSLLGSALELRWQPSPSLSLRSGMRNELWESRHDVLSSYLLRDFETRPRRTRISPHLGLRLRRGSWELETWGGVDLEPGAWALPIGGGLVSHRTGPWLLLAGAEHRTLSLSLLDQGGTGMEAASPAFVLPAGSPARTSQFQLEARSGSERPEARLAWHASALAWLRLHQGLWGWQDAPDRSRWTLELSPSRSDGWSRGLEFKADLLLGQFEFEGRYVLSQDVLQERGDGSWQPPSRWAPWDQRHRLEGDLGWTWVGPDRPEPGRFRWQSRLGARYGSGPVRSGVAGWTVADPERDIDTAGLPTWSKLSGPRRTQYLRLDLTPLRLGREGRWSVWWTVVNLTNEKNLSGWFGNRPAAIESAAQIPFLPVVFGAQIEF